MLRLRRLEAGRYQTPDGRYTILKDPQSGDELGGWGYVSWLTYDEGLDQEPIFEPVGALTEARSELARHIKRQDRTKRP